jgi:hypothetical protein
VKQISLRNLSYLLGQSYLPPPWTPFQQTEQAMPWILDEMLQLQHLQRLHVFEGTHNPRKQTEPGIINSRRRSTSWSHPSLFVLPCWSHFWKLSNERCQWGTTVKILSFGWKWLRCEDMAKIKLRRRDTWKRTRKSLRVCTKCRDAQPFLRGRQGQVLGRPCIGRRCAV